MHVMIAVLMLLAAVVASSVIARAAVSRLPLPFIQIALGGVLASVVDLHIAIEPELFLLLFIAPLLFLDGWRIPKEGLLQDKWTICALALGLVLFTVLGAGTFIHWVIPAMPLPVAFALAALLSPTDAVALSAIAVRAPIPRRLRHILEGEALLNDASGLVCFRFAIGAVLTGSFSIIEASTTFLWLAAGGVVVGASVAFLANSSKDWVSRRFGEETGSQILISLLIPFTAYLLAAQLQTSGILAAVAAGIAMNHEERTGHASPVTRIRRAAVWDAVQFAGNGVIFVLLGNQLHAIIGRAENIVEQTGHETGWWLAIYTLALTGVLFLLRFVWVWITLRLSAFQSERGPRTDWRIAATGAVGGVRGALTLSAAMSLPLTLRDGSPFPARDLAIILAAGVIIVSLALANATLPSLLKALPSTARAAHLPQEETARHEAAQAAIAAVEERLRSETGQPDDVELKMDAGVRIVEEYRRRTASRAATETELAVSRKTEESDRVLRIIALRAEREAYYRIARSGGLTDELARTLVRELDLQESHLAVRTTSET